MLSWRALARERPGGCHSAALTPRLPLTSVPRSPHRARRGRRHCGSSLCGPALVSSGVSPSARCPACSQRPRPLSFPRNRCWCRRSLSSSPPSLPFRLASAPPAQRAVGAVTSARGAWLRLPRFRRRARPYPGTLGGSAAPPRPGPARPARRPLPRAGGLVETEIWKLQGLYKAGLRRLFSPL